MELTNYDDVLKMISEENEEESMDSIWSGFECDICDQDDIYGPSLITLEASRGSKHDGERVTLNVCGDCMDWIYDRIIERAGKPKRITHW